MKNPESIPKFVIPAGLLATFCIGVGCLWDTVIHIQSGHTFFAPAHLFIIASVFLFALSGGMALYLTRNNSNPVSHGHLKTIAWGGATTFLAISIVDEAWHLLFGFDTSGWSPPHLLFWGGALIELFGLLMLERWTSGEYCYPNKKKIRVPQILIAASIFSVLLFLFLEFDVSHSHIAKIIPWFTYPTLTTLTFVSGAILVRRIVGKPFLTTIAAVTAWIFFWGTGTILEHAYQFEFVEPPFLIFLPALFLDLWPAIPRQENHSRFRKEFIVATIKASAVTYWMIIGWASLITHLPQQLSSTLSMWIVGFFAIVPCISLLSGYFTLHIAKYITYLEALAYRSTTSRS